MTLGMVEHEPGLRLVAGERGELEVSVALWRRFLGVADDEPQEVIAFVRGRPQVGYAVGEAAQVELLRRAQQTRDFAGAYLLANPIDPRIVERYPAGYFGAAHAGRASDKEIVQRRAVYIDVDAVRPKGISSTAEERAAAHEVARGVQDLLVARCGAGAVAFGSSGNGYFLLVAIEPLRVADDQGPRIRRLLAGLAAKFGTDAVSIDGSVFNAARLMPAPGTWKRKGSGSEERPHRLTSFSCRGNVARVPLEVLA